jgi:hypothetical protein
MKIMFGPDLHTFQTQGVPLDTRSEKKTEHLRIRLFVKCLEINRKCLRNFPEKVCNFIGSLLKLLKSFQKELKKKRELTFGEKKGSRFCKKNISSSFFLT